MGKGKGVRTKYPLVSLNDFNLIRRERRCIKEFYSFTQ